ncbi:MAG: hypothetical protein JNK78_20565 [Planctomycetes bacterium]|nr:hypothetical protein [Planctomycetota bacterium]
MVSIALRPPPRAVPLSVRFVLMFGGVLGTVGWSVVAFGLVFTLVFARIAAPLFDDPFAGPTDLTTGRVTSVERTNLRVNSSYVVAVHFDASARGATVSSVSYTRERPPDVGAEVPVEVARTGGVPPRIAGMSTHMAPAGLRLLVLIPVVGGVLVLVGMLRGQRQVRLLAFGELARGELIERRPTRTVVNGRPVEEFVFSFADRSGRERRVTARTHRPELVTDDDAEGVLFDPGSDAAVVVDALPGRPRVDESGELRAPSFGRLALALLGPTIAVLVWEIGGWIADS